MVEDYKEEVREKSMERRRKRGILVGREDRGEFTEELRANNGKKKEGGVHYFS